MIKTTVLIINKLGLHARAASKLVTTASGIMAVMMLAASKGTELNLEVEGSDEEDACHAVIDLINQRFEEDE